MSQSDNNCLICKLSLCDGETVKVVKGLSTLISASKRRKDGKHVSLEGLSDVILHSKCRREYTRDKNIEKVNIMKTTTENSPKLSFDYKKHCLLCTKECDNITKTKKKVKKGKEFSQVCSLHSKTMLLEKAVTRNDSWGQEVSCRIQSVVCLVAEQARYHKECYSKFSSNVPQHKTIGRPKNENFTNALGKLFEFIESTEECQYSMLELMQKVNSYLPGDTTMSMVYLKKQLTEKYGDEVVFVTMTNKYSVACFRGCKIKLEDWHKNRASTDEEEKIRIIRTAALFMLQDIRSTAYPNNYPDISNFMTDVENMIPDSLKNFLQIIISHRKKSTPNAEKKCTAIGHAIVSATRPRSFISPIQLGLGIYIFRKVGSKNLVNVVNSLGYCCSYRDVAMFESSAVQSWKPSIDDKAFTQYVFDNADFNTATMTGKGTFHSMGGIKCITPGNAVKPDIIEKKQLPTAEQLSIAHRITPLTFEQYNRSLDLLILKDVYKTGIYDEMAKLSNQDFTWLFGHFIEVPGLSGWQGFMAKLTATEPYETSKVIALPFVNQPPTDRSTVFTVLSHAAEETRKSDQHTCFVTFDLPLYMKAKKILAIINNESNGTLSNVVARLGGFHLLMSFLGSIGVVMAGSGLSELWSTVYAPASIIHMNSGHAYARAIRAHCLSLCAITTLIFEEMEINNNDKSYVEQILSSDLTYNSLESNETIEKLKVDLKNKILHLQDIGKTSKLWLQYCELVIIVLHFIQAERTGNWELHLDCVRAMLPIFHATAHFQYAKACQIYLQDMDTLKDKMNTEEYLKFTRKGFFTIRRSQKHWCGVWSDMTIEQTLMKNMKSVGGICHGRGFNESVLSKWIVVLPIAQFVSESIESYCGVRSSTSNQHEELKESRIKQDKTDHQKFVQWLKAHSPWSPTPNLVSLASGTVANESVNCFEAKSVGEDILSKAVQDGKKFGDLKLKRSSMVKTLANSKPDKIGPNLQNIDSTQLFQRIICTIHTPNELQACFSHELATVPLSLFQENGQMRKTQKSMLYKIFNEAEEPVIGEDNKYFVIDGGSLIHRVIWPSEGKFSDVYSAYVCYIRKNYGVNVTVVFDGYGENSASTKSNERMRRIINRKCPDIEFNDRTELSQPKQSLLSNLSNKQRLIAQLDNKFKNEGIPTLLANDDADVLIIQTALEESAKNKNVVVVGQDVDLLVLAIALTPAEQNIYLLKENQGTLKSRIYSSSLVKAGLIEKCKDSILFLHAMTGCDTTSSFFGKGKTQAIQIFNKRTDLQDIVGIFNKKDATQQEIDAAGDKFILTLYGARTCEKNLDEHRFMAFNKLVARAKTAVYLSKLPPTSSAAHQHSRRVYLQVQAWLGNVLNPAEWGWTKSEDFLNPILTEKSPAPASILKLISCACKQGCGKRCSCVKIGLRCTTMCISCRGLNCFNKSQDYEEPEQDEEAIE